MCSASAVTLVVVMLAAITVCLLVLVGALPDTTTGRVILAGAAVMALATLLVRISAGVIKATAP